jgi:hypothetical protein
VDGLEYAAAEVYVAESGLCRALHRLADDHADDPEIRSVASHLAGWSRTNAELVAKLTRSTSTPDDVPAETGATRSAPSPPIALLQDLRALHAQAASVSLAWEMLRQVAQATRRQDVVDLAGRCQQQTLRQMKWATTSLKTLAPQALASFSPATPRS